MSLSRAEQNKLDSQIVQVYDGLGALSRMIATLEESIEYIDGEVWTGAEERVAPIATAEERAAIAAQLQTWASVMKTRWTDHGP